MSSQRDKVRVGLVVAFAALGEGERRAAETAWACAVAGAQNWTPAFEAYGLDPVTEQAQTADVLVYLGESSRFQGVAGEASQSVPVVFVKSTVEELLHRPPNAAPRYRMCTGVKGVARALASVAPSGPTVDWKALPWPESVVRLTELDKAEESYVRISVGAFREAAEERGIPWTAEVPAGEQPFSVFLTMHDPAAAKLADAALRLWPNCTVLAADGMVSTASPTGKPWPDRLARVRHWATQSQSESTEAFRELLRGKSLPDFDSAGMLFGTLYFLDHAFGAGAAPSRLESAGEQPGPLGPVTMTASGRPQPERVVIFQGDQVKVVEIE